MRALLTVLLMSLSFAVHAKSAEDWLKEGDDALKGVGKEIVDAADCIGKSPSGRIELLGVESDMGPSTQGVSPALKLGPNHEAMKALRPLQEQMWGTRELFDRDPAAYQRVQKRHYAYYWFSGSISGSKIEQGNREEIANWEEWGLLYREWLELARQYAPLWQAAEAAGKGCP